MPPKPPKGLPLTKPCARVGAITQAKTQKKPAFMRLNRHLLSTTLLMLAASAAAFAETKLHGGVIHPGGFPSPAGFIAAEVADIYNIIFIIISIVAVVVALPILYILWRFRREKVAKPATFTHHLGIELLWTIIPAIICIYITYISFMGMATLRTMPEDGINVEAVAYQFGWDFYYPDASENGTHVAVAEATKADPEISLSGLERSTKELVVPIGVPIKLHVTAADVIHAFFAPALGVKVDAVPGRINYLWFQADKPGSWLGQCAELCGSAHSEMFFRVKAVPMDEFKAYIKERRVAAGLTPEPVAPPADASSTVPADTSATVVSATVVSGTAEVK